MTACNIMNWKRWRVEQ